MHALYLTVILALALWILMALVRHVKTIEVSAADLHQVTGSDWGLFLALAFALSTCVVAMALSL